MESKSCPKCLIGTDEIGFETTLATSSGLGGPKGAFTRPHAAHFDLLFTPFGPQFQYPAAVLALPPMYIWLAKFISQFDKRALLSTTCISNIISRVCLQSMLGADLCYYFQTLLGMYHARGASMYYSHTICLHFGMTACTSYCHSPCLYSAIR